MLRDKTTRSVTESGQRSGKRVLFRRARFHHRWLLALLFARGQIKRGKIIKLEGGGGGGGTGPLKGRLITPGHVLIIARGFARLLIRRDEARNEPRLMLTSGFQFRGRRIRLDPSRMTPQRTDSLEECSRR